MKVIRQTSAQFQGEIPPSCIAGILFTLIGVAIVFFFGQSLHIDCSRDPSGALKVQGPRAWFGIPVSHETIHSLASARVESRRNKEGETLYRIVLTTASGDYPLTQSFSGRLAPKKETVQAFNAFIGDSNQPRFVRVEKPHWMVIAAGSLFALVGLVVARDRAEVLMDRESDTFTLIRKGLFGSKTLRFRLSDIERFEVRSKEAHHDRRRIVYNTGLVLRNGTFVPFRNSASSAYSRRHAAVEILQQFLHSAPQRHSMGTAPTLSMAVDSARKLCILCGEDCSTELRYQDPNGRYYHPDCFQRAHGSGGTG